MSQTNFYKKYSEELVWGLVSGLVWGLVSGLVLGLVVILINFSEALPFLSGLPQIIFLILGIVLISEIMFWLSKKEKLSKGTNIFWHTCKRKLENIFEVLLGFSVIVQIYVFVRELKIRIPFEIILKWIGYIGAGLVCLVAVIIIFYVWIKLNSYKFRK